MTNVIGDRKYLALCMLLTPVGASGMKNIGQTPWSMESTRTFTCSCGHKHIVPENALVLGNDDATRDLVMVNMGVNTKCPKCGGENYELLSFAWRYGLLRASPRPRKPKSKERALPFTGGVQCGGSKIHG